MTDEEKDKLIGLYIDWTKGGNRFTCHVCESKLNLDNCDGCPICRKYTLKEIINKIIKVQ